MWDKKGLWSESFSFNFWAFLLLSEEFSPFEHLQVKKECLKSKELGENDFYLFKKWMKSQSKFSIANEQMKSKV